MDIFSKRRWIFELGVILILLAILSLVASRYAHLPLSAHPNAAAYDYVRYSLHIAETGEIYPTTIDPPLRYATLSIVYFITDPTTEEAWRIANLHAATISHIVTPLTIWALIRIVSTRRAALAGLGAIVALRVVEFNFASPEYFFGGWQYDLVRPYIFTALIFVHLAIDGAADKRTRYTVIAGVLLGLVGLQQLLFAGLTIIAVVVAYVWHRHYHALTLTIATGLVFTPALLFIPPRGDSRMASLFVEKTLHDIGPASEILVVLTSPILLAYIFVGLAPALWQVATDIDMRQTGMLPLVTALLFGMWTLAEVSGLDYFAGHLPGLVYPLAVANTTIFLVSVSTRTSEVAEVVAHLKERAGESG